MANFTKIKQFVVSYLKEHLSKDLYYHGLHHTFDVLEFALEIAEAEKIMKKELALLKIAVLFHDIGFVHTYAGHEEEGCKLANQFLPDFKVSQEDIDIICGMIRATIIPQSPTNNLEKIIADADLMYLGTPRFKEIGDTLFKEMSVYFDLHTEHKWNQIQKTFIEKHQFHTAYCKKKYEAPKQKNLKKVVLALQ